MDVFDWLTVYNLIDSFKHIIYMYSHIGHSYPTVVCPVVLFDCWYHSYFSSTRLSNIVIVISNNFTATQRRVPVSHDININNVYCSTYLGYMCLQSFIPP